MFFPCYFSQQCRVSRILPYTSLPLGPSSFSQLCKYCHYQLNHHIINIINHHHHQFHAQACLWVFSPLLSFISIVITQITTIKDIKQNISNGNVVIIELHKLFFLFLSFSTPSMLKSQLNIKLDQYHQHQRATSSRTLSSTPF